MFNSINYSWLSEGECLSQHMFDSFIDIARKLIVGEPLTANECTTRRRLSEKYAEIVAKLRFTTKAFEMVPMTPTTPGIPSDQLASLFGFEEMAPAMPTQAPPTVISAPVDDEDGTGVLFTSTTVISAPVDDEDGTGVLFTPTMPARASPVAARTGEHHQAAAFESVASIQNQPLTPVAVTSSVASFQNQALTPVAVTPAAAAASAIAETSPVASIQNQTLAPVAETSPVNTVASKWPDDVDKKHHVILDAILDRINTSCEIGESQLHVISNELFFKDMPGINDVLNKKKTPGSRQVKKWFEIINKVEPRLKNVNGNTYNHKKIISLTTLDQVDKYVSKMDAEKCKDDIVAHGETHVQLVQNTGAITGIFFKNGRCTDGMRKVLNDANPLTNPTSKRKSKNPTVQGSVKRARKMSSSVTSSSSVAGPSSASSSFTAGPSSASSSSAAGPSSASPVHSAAYDVVMEEQGENDIDSPHSLDDE
ncbi:hypothetical protein GGF31_003447 [Allomyces arbusculus]|nr:hypothetical protein GGF31_003447 [Allomyces arbusculus]